MPIRHLVHTVKRVSNALNTPNADQGGYLSWIENEYSTMSPFNSDNSKFVLVHQSYFGLYDGSETSCIPCHWRSTLPASRASPAKTT
jgi:hypothetical protein